MGCSPYVPYYGGMTWLRTIALPLQFASLSFLAITTVLVVMAMRNIPSNIVIAILLLFMALSWLNKYAFALLDAAANGRREAPVASVEMLGPFNDLRVWVHPALLLVAGGLAWRLGSPGGPVLLAIVALLLPASIAAVAMSGRLTDAVNPVEVWSAMRGLGPLYPVTLIGGVFFGLFVWTVVHGALTVPLAAALAGLAFLEWYAVIGASVFHRRFDLDFTPVADPEGKAQRLELERQRRRQAVLDEFYGAIRAREAVRATAATQAWLSQATPAQRAVDVDFFVAQAAAWPEQKGLSTLLRGVITYALGSQQPALATRATEEGIARIPGFAPDDAAEAEAVAIAARQSGRRRLAAQVIDNFVAARPGRPVPESLAALRADLPG